MPACQHSHASVTYAQGHAVYLQESPSKYSLSQCSRDLDDTSCMLSEKPVPILYMLSEVQWVRSWETYMRWLAICCAERTAVEAARTEGPLFGYSLRQRWGYLDGQKQSKGESFGEDLLREGWEGAGMSQSGESAACARGAEGRLVPEEKHAVCFRDRGRSLEAGGLPGGAVCFGGHEGLWHALRALVRTYEYCA